MGDEGEIQRKEVLGCLLRYDGPFYPIVGLGPFRAIREPDFMDFLAEESDLPVTETDVAEALQSVGGERDELFRPWLRPINWLARVAHEPPLRPSFILVIPERFFESVGTDTTPAALEDRERQGRKVSRRIRATARVLVRAISASIAFGVVLGVIRQDLGTTSNLLAAGIFGGAVAIFESASLIARQRSTPQRK